MMTHCDVTGVLVLARATGQALSRLLVKGQADPSLWER